LFVALQPGIYLLLCKYPLLTLVFGQRIPEDGNVIAAQFTRVADRVKYGPPNEFDAILLNNFPFVILIIYVNIGVRVMLVFENIL